MKAAIITAVLVFICAAAMPLLSLDKKTVSAAVASVIPEGVIAEKPVKGATETFKIKMSSDGSIKTLSAEEYICGVLCGEIPPAYENEALKAQAVAAYTFALRRAAAAKKAGRDYDLTDSPETDQCYVEKDSLKEKWGDKTDEYYEKIKKAVSAVSGVAVLYKGEPALTAYHAISSGVTASSKEVWGSELPYLVSVESMGDKLSSGYLSSVSFKEAALAEKMKSLCTVAAGANAFSDIALSDSGRVKSLKCGGKELSGGDVQKALGLRSANFDVAYENGNYVFTVRGSGHGVGMSQEGAQYMAKQGSSYKEILLHYYKGCDIGKS